MNIGMNWTNLKSIVSSKTLSLQYDEGWWEDSYKVFAIDGLIAYVVRIFKTDPRNADQIDFEDNYKSLSNIAITNNYGNPTPVVTSVSESQDKTVSGNNVSIPNSAWTTVCDFNTTAGGKSFINSVVLSSDTSTLIKIRVKDVTNGSVKRNYWSNLYLTTINDRIIIKNTGVGGLSTELQVYQSSGGTINITGVMLVTKIK